MQYSYYLDGEKCNENCPGKIADILTSKCIEVKDNNIDVLYTKSYSIGSCKNMCGKVVKDCSCSPSCKSNGTCCTDYDTWNCDLLIEKNIKVENCGDKIDNCELCDSNLPINRVENRKTDDKKNEDKKAEDKKVEDKNKS